jgi:hypothetical protein
VIVAWIKLIIEFAVLLFALVIAVMTINHIQKSETFKTQISAEGE